MRQFEGVLAYVDCESDQGPSGARGKKIFLPKNIAQASLHTLIDKPVNRARNFDTHDRNNIIGKITEAKIDRKNRIRVKGFIDEKIPAKQRKSLGMSFELRGVHIENMRDSTWKISRLEEFEGVAILRKKKAAYQQTSFRIKRGIKCLSTS